MEASSGSYPCYPTMPNWNDMFDVGGVPVQDACLNTPDIVDLLDSVDCGGPFSMGTKVKGLDTIKMEMMSSHEATLYSNSDSFFGAPTLSQTNSGPTTYNAFQTPPPYNGSNYDRHSPYLESSEINLDYLNSPEMAPVSPNKVCPASEYQAYPTPYQPDYSDSMGSAGATNDTSYLLGDFLTSSSASSEELISTSPTSTYQQLNPYSPASSHYSIDSHSASPASTSSAAGASSHKTYVNLDAVQIKPEPIESSIYMVPTVVDEQLFSSSTSTSSTTSIINPDPYYYLQQGPTATPATTTSAVATPTTQPSTSSNRKRNSTTSHFGGVPAPGQKKQRVTKREKQKMMEQCIERYERENKQLAAQIDLFEKQINFCKKYLSENVAPYIQKQQAVQPAIQQQIQTFIAV